jgi:hypothetical protein
VAEKPVLASTSGIATASAHYDIRKFLIFRLLFPRLPAVSYFFPIVGMLVKANSLKWHHKRKFMEDR